MKHPSDEQWMEYIYNEISAAEKAGIKSHLNACPQCAGKLAGFQGALRSLDQWRVQARPRYQLTHWRPTLKWAAVAAVLITTAFAAGRVSRNEIDTTAIEAKLNQRLEARMIAARAEIQNEFERQIQEFSERTLAEALAANKRQIEQLTAALAIVREEDRKAMLSAIEVLEEQQIASLRDLRGDLEKVALYTDHGFKSAQRQMVRLAGYTQSAKE